MRVYKPYSENLIFFDTEYAGNDTCESSMLSIGMIKMNGDKLYLELEYDGPVSDWVRSNILPTLKNKKVSGEEACMKIKKFIGRGKPYLISYIASYDTIYLHKLFGFEAFEKTNMHTWPVDFASVLFAYGMDPDGLVGEGLVDIARVLKIDLGEYQLHNALDDARLLREVYLKLVVNEK
jgi:hypothetical protein